MKYRIAVTAVSLICLACADTASPDRIRLGFAVFAPVFSSNASPVVAISAITVQLTRLDGSVAFEQTFQTQPGQNEYTLDLEVEIRSENEQFDLTFTIFDPDGNPVYRSDPDPQRITVSTSTNLAPIEVVLQYVGPGSNAESLEIQPPDTSISVGATLQLTLTARDGAGGLVLDLPVSWTVLNPIVVLDSAGATTPSTATVTAGSVTGVATVEVRGANGSVDSATVTVVPTPVVDVTISTPSPGSSFDAGENVTFAGSAAHSVEGDLPGAALRWESDADGTIGTGLSITRNDLTIGPHLITLFATGSDGVQGTANVSITIVAANQPPTANAGTDRTVPDLDLNGVETVTLDATGSSDPDGTIVMYTWMEGTTSLASGPSPTAIVDLNLGAHSLTLTVTDDRGATDTDQVVVTVTPGNMPPVANAGVDQGVSDADGSGSEAVTLDGSSSSDPDGTVVSYEWSEGQTVLGSGPTLPVDLGVGVHTIDLLVTDDGGATDTDQVTMTVAANQQPAAVINAPTTGSQFQTVDQITFSGAATDPENGTLSGGSLVWTSDIDGQIGTGSSFATTLSAGTHLITLTASDGGGLFDAVMVTITVNPTNEPPVPVITQPLNGAQFVGTDQITFVGSAADLEDGSLTGSALVWASDQDGQIGTGTTFSTGLSIGIHLITLTATDSDANSVQVSVTITVVNQNPTAVIETPTNGAQFITTDQITFTGTGSDPEDGSLTGTALVWTSDLDGQIGTGNTFATALTVGTHVVTLTATDGGGLSGTANVTIIVDPTNELPVPTILQPLNGAQFVGTDQITFVGSATDLEDGSLTGGALVWTSSQDGQIGTGTTFVTGLSTGSHTITLTATDSDANSVQTSVTITVANQTPTAAIETPSNGAQFQVTDQITFTGAGTDPEDGTLTGTSLVWSSDLQGQIGTGTTFATTLTVGTHVITLTATDSGNLSDAVAVTITVNPTNTPPVPSITQPLNGAQFVGTDQITFVGSATDLEDGTLTGGALVWTSSLDGQIGTGTSFTTVLSVGTHTISLTATDSDLNSVAVAISVVVQNQNPSAVINAPPNDTLFLSTVQIQFSGTATDPEDGSLTGASLVWTSSLDGQIGTGASFASSLSIGVHIITLTATDGDGGTGSANVTIGVLNQSPTAAAGTDQTVTDADLSGAESVTLDGSGSTDVDGTIVDYTWTEGQTTLASGANSTPVVNLTLGVHTVTLTVTDDRGATDTDQVVFTVDPGSAALRILGSGTGSGTVRSNPAGIDCTITDGSATGACSALFIAGTQLTLTATPSPDGIHQFVAWTGSGIDCPEPGPCVLTTNDNLSVTAQFNEFHPLTVLGAGTGTGTVVGGGGISCAISRGQTEGTCSVLFAEGVNTVLTAVADLGSSFTGWLGDCTGDACTLNMTQPRSATATFTALQPDLVISTPITANPTSVRPGGSTQLSAWTVLNQGQAASGSFSNGFYLSTDATITNADVLLTVNSNLSLAPGASFQWGGPNLAIPVNTVPGQYYIGILVDYPNGVAESNEANNFVSTPLTVTGPPGPPTISNLTVQLVVLNDAASCGNQNPPGSLFRYTMDYTDPDGNVTQEGAVLTTVYQFNQGSSGQFSQPPQPGLSVSGDGFNGQISSLICNQFLNSTSVLDTFTLQDAAGNISNAIEISVARPEGSNGPNLSFGANGGASTNQSGGAGSR